MDLDDTPEQAAYRTQVQTWLAEHKSQGLLQTMDDKDPKEYIWIDAESAPDAQAAADSLFHLLSTGSSENQKLP